MSLNALSTATAGLAATQAAINVVSQNVANAGTAGYVKRTLSTVATGAALAVTAPIAVVDPQTRETYGDHVASVGSGLRDTVSSTVGLVGIR